MNLRYLHLTLFFLMISFNLSAQVPGEQIFDNSVVHEIRFEFSEANYWEQLLTISRFNRCAF